ncbi:MAG: nucleoside deaminase, partial [Rikenellaceae bacterium]|nr:nucleoside deaminase [Rikenellaceae bacterium]
MERIDRKDDFFMRMAINEASAALKKGEVPIGAVVVCGDRVVGRGHNLTESLGDATAHAEMQAITAAAASLGGKYLDKCTLYVTVEPCVMCAGACYWSQLGEVVWGADDPKRGFSTVGGRILHPKTK